MPAKHTETTPYWVTSATFPQFAKLGEDLVTDVSDALWWDTNDPYSYLRVEPHRDSDVVIFGGEDHKTGQETDTVGCYQRLEEHLAAIVPQIDLTHRDVISGPAEAPLSKVE